MTISRFDDLIDAYETPFENLKNSYKTPLASFRLATDDSDIFKNTHSNDVVLMGLTHGQTIRISPSNETSESVVNITGSNLHVIAPAGFQLDGNMTARNDVEIDHDLRVQNLTTLNDVSLDGVLQTDGVLTTSGFLLVNDNDDGVLYAHDEGVFVGGKLHVNVDFPKHVVDINGDFACTGPVFIGGDTRLRGTLNVDNNVVINGTQEIENDASITKGNFYVTRNKLKLEQETLSVPYVHALEDVNVDGALQVTGNTMMGSNLYLYDNKFSVENELVNVERLKVKDIAILEKDLIVFEDINIRGNLFLDNNGFSVLDNKLTTQELFVSSNISIDGHSTLKGSVDIRGNLYLPKNNVYIENNDVRLHRLFAQTVDVNNSILVKHDIVGERIIKGKRIEGDIVDIHGQLFLKGDASLDSDIYVGNDVFAGRNIIVSSNIEILGTSKVHEKLVANLIDVETDLKVQNNIVVNSNLEVFQDEVIHGFLNVNNKSFVVDDLGVKIMDEIHAHDHIHAYNGLSVSSNVNIAGNLLLENFSVTSDLVNASNITTSNLDVYGELRVKNKIFIEGELNFLNSTVGIFENNIFADSFTSYENTFVKKTLDVVKDVVVREGDLKVLQGKLHVNVDIPKHTVDIGGDIRSTGPLYVESFTKISGDLEIGTDVLCHGSHEVINDLTVTNGNIYAPRHGLSLKDDTLQVKKLNVLQRVDVEDEIHVEGVSSFGSSLVSLDNNFIVQNGILTVSNIHVDDKSTVNTIKVENDLVVEGSITSQSNGFEVKNSLVKVQDINVSNAANIDNALTVKNELSVMGSLFMPQNNFSVSNKLVQLDDLHAKYIKTDSLFTTNAITTKHVDSDRLVLNKDGNVIDTVLDVKGDALLEGLVVDGESHLMSVQVLSNIDIEGNIFVNNNLEVKGDTKLELVYVASNLELEHNLLVNNNLEVREESQFNRVYISELEVSNDSHLYGNLYLDHFKIEDNIVTASNLKTSNLNTLNLEVSGDMVSKNKLIIEGEIDLINSRINITNNSIEADTLTSFENTFVQKSLDVMNNIVVQTGDINILEGKLRGNIETSEFSTHSFVFLRNEENENENENDRFAVAYIHDDGVFVGGNLHVNVDLPKHVVDIDGDMRCSGPVYFENNLHVSQEVHVARNLICKQDLIVNRNILSSSDRRLKHDICKVDDCLGRLSKLYAYTFKMKADENQRLLCGLIAQEVQECIPEVVNEDEQTGYLSIAYGNLVSILIGAINQLSSQFEIDKDVQKKENLNILARLDRLERESRF